jgi:hypothetical protein
MMNDDDDMWLRELARVAQEEEDAGQARLDERWDRLSAGELSPDEEAELRALAAASEEGREAYEAFRPLGPEFQAGVVRALQAQITESPAESPPVPEPAMPEPEKLARVLPFRGRAVRLGAWVAAAAAVAASLFLIRPPVTLPPLPAYGPPELSGGVQEMRGEEEGPRTFSNGDPFEVILRPETAVSGNVAVHFFLAHGAELRPWPVPAAAISSDGVVSITGTLGRDIRIPPGAWTLRAVVGRPGKLPDAAALRAHLAQGRARAPDWVVLSTDFKVVK